MAPANHRMGLKARRIPATFPAGNFLARISASYRNSEGYLCAASIASIAFAAARPSEPLRYAAALVSVEKENIR